MSKPRTGSWRYLFKRIGRDRRPPPGRQPDTAHTHTHTKYTKHTSNCSVFKWIIEVELKTSKAALHNPKMPKLNQVFPLRGSHQGVPLIALPVKGFWCRRALLQFLQLPGRIHQATGSLHDEWEDLREEVGFAVLRPEMPSAAARLWMMMIDDEQLLMMDGDEHTV